MNDKQLTSTFVRLRRRLLHTAQQILHDRDKAEDALQDAFVKLWERSDVAERSQQETDALAQVTVKRLSIDAWRRERTLPVADMADAETIGEASTKEAAAEREALLEEVEALIGEELTPLQQRLLQKRDAEGRDYDTIAAEERMTPAAVRMQLSRARQKIRECYKRRRQHE